MSLVAIVLALIVYIFQGVPGQLAKNNEQLVLLTYQVSELNKDVTISRSFQQKQNALEQQVVGIDKRVDKLEEKRFSAFPPIGKR